MNEPGKNRSSAKLSNPGAIYLDICALCRPYDVQTFLRIRMEPDAVNLILANVIRKRYQINKRDRN